MFLRLCLSVMSLFYGVVVRLRNWAYDIGLKATAEVGRPVISVGNLTTGGTGKTPFVAHLASWFAQRDGRIALLSRGYRSGPEEVNDEKLLLDHLCGPIPHWQNPDRVESARRALVEDPQLGLFILDDGFQHRRVGRTLNIVLLDLTNPWGFGHLLPRGLLREPIRSLRRADLVVLTRADLCPAETIAAVKSRLKRVRGTDECVEVAFIPQRLVNSQGDQAELSSLAGQSLAAFCAIGNPNGFRDTLRSCDLSPAVWKTFPDHHHYTAAELDELAAEFASPKISAAVTTQKDLVKIPRTHLGETPLWAVAIGMEILRGESLLEDKLSAFL